MEAEQRVEVERAMMEEKRWVSEEDVRVSVKLQDIAEAVRVERERKFKAKRRATKEKTAHIEAER